MKKNRIVLGQPYTGTLYAFFHDDYEISQCDDARHLSSHTTHPYYQRLYGEFSSELLDMSLMILTMFDEVYTFPADARYPKQDIGFHADWDIFSEYKKSNEKQLAEAYEKLAQNIEADEWKSKLLFEETSYITYLANRLNCPVICGESTRTFMDTINCEEPFEKISKTEKFISDYRNLMAPIFYTPNLQSLQNIKNDSEVQNCAKSFINIMLSNSSKVEEVPMKTLLTEALNSQSFSKKVSHVNCIADEISFYAGFIPIIGSFVGIPPYLSGKALSLYNYKVQWHELGSKISKVEKHNLLEERLKGL